jgi:hypothetical protein
MTETVSVILNEPKKRGIISYWLLTVFCRLALFNTITMTEENKPEEQKDVIADFANELKESEMQGYQPGVRKARNALFVAGALIFIAEMINMYNVFGGVDQIVMIIAIIEAAVFIALAFWTKKKPYTAIITGIIAFVIIVIVFPLVVSIINDDTENIIKAIFGGIIIKVVILVNLIVPLKDAKALQEAMKEKY